MRSDCPRPGWSISKEKSVNGSQKKKKYKEAKEITVQREEKKSFLCREKNKKEKKKNRCRSRVEAVLPRRDSGEKGNMKMGLDTQLARIYTIPFRRRTCNMRFILCPAGLKRPLFVHTTQRKRETNLFHARAVFIRPFFTTRCQFPSVKAGTGPSNLWISPTFFFLAFTRFFGFYETD